MTNYNHLHVPSGEVISSTSGQITVGNLRDAIALLPDDADIFLAPCDCGLILHLAGFKNRGPMAISCHVRCEEWPPEK